MILCILSRETPDKYPWFLNCIIIRGSAHGNACTTSSVPQGAGFRQTGNTRLKGEKVMKGVIFDIEEFAVHDGPGIRQVVFFKGCPLRCSWCHNPEGVEHGRQLMVSKSSCIVCNACKQVCKNGSCIACGACVEVCPLHLRRIVGESIDSKELADRIRKSDSYYQKYGGGVTFSGGEPMMQGEFLLDTLMQLEGIHCAVETSGYCPSRIFSAVVERLDYVIMDLKMMDAEKHRKYTGVDPAIIWENLKHLAAGSTPFVIRIPLIPGVNDDEHNYRMTAQLLAGMPMLERVELLPYNRAAGAKYEMVGRRFTPDFDTEAQVRIRPDIFEEYGIRSAVL